MFGLKADKLSCQLRHIPTVGGPSLPILSFLGVYSYYFRHRETLQKGYNKVSSL